MTVSMPAAKVSVSEQALRQRSISPRMVSNIFLMKLIASGKFEQIDNFLLIRGHTFLPNDCDFSIIEER